MLFISATDTNVGKTYAAAEILAAVSKVLPAKKILYYKIIQCGRDPETGDDDIAVVKRRNPEIDFFSSYFLEYPGAPLLAAELESVTLDKDKIQEDFNRLQGEYDFILAEGAGGLAVPLNYDLWISDLVKLLDLPLVLVARPDLGTINHSMQTIAYARAKAKDPEALILSEYSQELNRVIDFAGALPPHIKTAPEIIAKSAAVDVYTGVENFIQNKLPSYIKQRADV